MTPLDDLTNLINRKLQEEVSIGVRQAIATALEDAVDDAIPPSQPLRARGERLLGTDQPGLLDNDAGWRLARPSAV